MSSTRFCTRPTVWENVLLCTQSCNAPGVNKPLKNNSRHIYIIHSFIDPALYYVTTIPSQCPWNLKITKVDTATPVTSVCFCVPHQASAYGVQEVGHSGGMPVWTNVTMYNIDILGSIPKRWNIIYLSFAFPGCSTQSNETITKKTFPFSLLIYYFIPCDIISVLLFAMQDDHGWWVMAGKVLLPASILVSRTLSPDASSALNLGRGYTHIIIVNLPR